MNRNTGTSHLEDGDLVRILDGEVEGGPLPGHVATCPECLARLGIVRGRSRRLAVLLTVHGETMTVPGFGEGFLERLGSAAKDAPTSAGRRAGRRQRLPRRGMAWLAGAAALMAVLLSFSPVRGWLVARVGAAWAWVRGTSPRPEPATPPGAVHSEVSSTVAGPVFTIRTTTTSAPRTVMVRSVTGSLARARLEGAGPGGEILVRSDGIEVRSPAGDGVFDVWVPATVREVRVLVDGAERTRRAFREPSKEPWRVDLR